MEIPSLNVRLERYHSCISQMNHSLTSYLPNARSIDQKSVFVANPPAPSTSTMTVSNSPQYTYLNATRGSSSSSILGLLTRPTELDLLLPATYHPPRTLRHPDRQSRYRRLNRMTYTVQPQCVHHLIPCRKQAQVVLHTSGERTEDEGVTAAPILHHPGVFSDEMHCTFYLSFNHLSCMRFIRTWKQPIKAVQYLQ